MGLTHMNVDFHVHHDVGQLNKAGYTAISCGRVGRGGNATVHN